MSPAAAADTLIDRFVATLTANGGRAHGPLPRSAAADLAVALCREHAAGAAVALASGDPVIHALGLAARLEGAGVDVLHPGDLFWRDRLASAGAGLTGAILALAASGSVGVACGPGAPRSVGLVPPAHICLVDGANMVEDLAEALHRCTPLPSGLVWVSGPSRSADLEMTLTVGVHGPGSVDVIVFEGNAG